MLSIVPSGLKQYFPFSAPPFLCFRVAESHILFPPPPIHIPTSQLALNAAKLGTSASTSQPALEMAMNAKANLQQALNPQVSPCARCSCSCFFNTLMSRMKKSSAEEGKGSLSSRASGYWEEVDTLDAFIESFPLMPSHLQLLAHLNRSAAAKPVTPLSFAEYPPESDPPFAPLEDSAPSS